VGGFVARADVGVIGGSGLYEIDGLTDLEHIDVSTPFGNPSDTLTLGTLGGIKVAFVPRHGRGHRLLPSEVPYRANIFALKSLGVTQVISASAVGSLREELQPMEMVVPEQIFDRTKARASTFFGDGIVAHIAFADPFCHQIAEELVSASEMVVERTHAGGTYVCMEGPAFSTYAESVTYKQLGFDIIGMTAVPEAKLAREAEMCYAVLAQVTDYDCWHESHESVSSDLVMANVARNVVNAKSIIRQVLPRLREIEDCSCRHALEGAIATAPEAISEEARKRLEPLLTQSLAQPVRG
jgi:5'-methylthioadenosine phosphorylase